MIDILSKFFDALLFALAESAPFILIGYLIAGIVREFVPMHVLTGYFGSRGIKPLLRAVSIGLVLPICSCGVIPLGIGAYRSGAARGTALSFMTSTPALSPAAILLLFSLLGTKLAMLHIAAVVVSSFLLGALGNWLLDRKNRDTDQSGRQETPSCCAGEEPSESCCEGADRTSQPSGQQKPSITKRLASAANWVFWDFGSDLSFDMLMGLSLASLILAFVPPEWTTTWLGTQSSYALIFVVIAAIPIYTCIIPSIPIVQSLLLSGMSPGAAVAFLIAGPATNLGEMNAIRGQMGKRTALYYGACLILLAILSGAMVNNLFYADYVYTSQTVAGAEVPKTCCIPIPAETVTQGHSLLGHASHIALWRWPFILLLVVMLVVGASRRTAATWKNWTGASDTEKPDTAQACCSPESQQNSITSQQQEEPRVYHIQ